jgi:membrane protease YdiL (CAAX protease family)
MSSEVRNLSDPSDGSRRAGTQGPETSDRFHWFEYSRSDFPFYDGRPATLSGLQWLFVLLMVAVGFLALATPMLPVPGYPGELLRAVLFPGIPLVGLAIVAPTSWTSLFRSVSGRDVLWMIGFGLLNLAVTVTVASVVMRLVGVDANPLVAGLSSRSAAELLRVLVLTIPQLLGEEVLTMLPFLAVMHLLFTRLNLSRRQSIVGAWLISAVIFGLVHLPTYNWNWIQCLVIIGSARLVLSLAYIKTKNLWVSTGAHIFNDWVIFGLSILLASLAAR